MKDRTKGLAVLAAIVAGAVAFTINPFLAIVVGIVAAPFVIFTCGVVAVISEARKPRP